MKAWIFLLLLVTVCSCQSDRSAVPDTEVDLPVELEDTTTHMATGSVDWFFIFQKDEKAIYNNNTLEISNLPLLHQLPPGVYSVRSDSIIYGTAPGLWTGSGQLQWPENSAIALSDLFDKTSLINAKQVAIFPNQPGADGKLSPCFACPWWMSRKYGRLAGLWEAQKKSFDPLPEE